MTDTTTLPPGGSGGAGELRDLDSRGVLDLVVDRRRAADAAEARLLAGVVHLVDLYPVTDPDAEDAAYIGVNDRPLTALEAGPAYRLPIAGVGCPQVREDGVVALAAALGVPYRRALSLVGESLELCYRLPRLWNLVQTGQLQAWKARRVARDTTALSVAAVAFVDGHLSVTGIRNHVPVNLGPILTLALNRCDPDIAEGREEAALAARHVSFDYSSSTDSGATADLIARLDILDALDLDHQITALAAEMARLGDTSPLGVRRAHALGILANPQHTLNIFGTTPDTDAGTGCGTDTDTDDDGGGDTDTAAGSAGSAGSAPAGPVSAGQRGSVTGSAAGLAEAAVRGGIGGRLNATGATLYLHITAADLATTLAHPNTDDSTDNTDSNSGGGDSSGSDGRDSGDSGGVAGAGGADSACAGGGVRVEKLNSITLGLLQQWLQRTHSVTIRPVLDMSRTDAVDPHDPPGWMREAVILRDQHCVFPGCGIDARVCDQDHIVPYQPMDAGGPPGQTHLGNLACLCRRHHRMKTSRIWHYQRLPDHSYQWTSPHGHHYTTHPGNQPGSQPGHQPGSEAGTRPDRR